MIEESAEFDSISLLQALRVSDRLSPQQREVWAELCAALLPTWKAISRPGIGGILAWVPADATPGDIAGHRSPEIECGSEADINSGVKVRLWLERLPGSGVVSLNFASIRQLTDKLREACNCDYVHASNTYALAF